VFKRKALEVVEVLSSSKFVSNKNELKSELNPNGKQRSGSFEITITLADGQEILVTHFHNIFEHLTKRLSL
jgi:hypothetical protein